MRHIILALMIILLPLRSWVSDVMATEMATEMAYSGGSHLQIAVNADTNNAHPADAAQAMLPDCTGHGAALGAADALGAVNALGVADASEPESHCSTCTVCQVCHTVALLPAAVHSATGLAPPTLPNTSPASFASALVALGQKPPIS